MNTTASEWTSISLVGVNLRKSIGWASKALEPPRLREQAFNASGWPVLLNIKPPWIHGKLPWLKGGPPWPYVSLHDSSRESPRLQVVLCGLFVSQYGSRWVSLQAPCKISMSTQWASIRLQSESLMLQFRLTFNAWGQVFSKAPARFLLLQKWYAQ